MEASTVLSPQDSALWEASFWSSHSAHGWQLGDTALSPDPPPRLPVFPRDRAMKELSQAAPSRLSPSHQTAGINEKM